MRLMAVPSKNCLWVSRLFL